VNLPLANGKYRKPAEVIVKVLCFSGLAIWFFHLYIFLQYDATRPRHIDTSSGRVCAQNNHGNIVYLTKAEDTGLTKLSVLAFSLMGAGFLTGGLFVERIGWRRRPEPWEKKQW